MRLAGPRRLLPVLATSVLAAAPAAWAALPAPRTTRIVDGVSIAGVRIDATRTAARNAWGVGSCTTRLVGTTCIFRNSRKPSYGTARYRLLRSGAVGEVKITAGTRDGRYVFEGPLDDWRNAKGIHLGSRRSTLLNAYSNETVEGRRITVPGAGEAVTRFMTTSTASTSRVRTIWVTVFSQ